VCVWRSGVVAAAAGRENYNAYNYDLTTPLLTPDGRILQVEYASMAPSHSSPLVAIQTGTHMILATLQRKPFGGRIVTLPTGVSSSSGSTVVVGVSGILSDGMSLVQEGRQALVSQYCTYGESSSCGGGESVSKRVAQAMGNACQGRAMGGGLRAYGASLLVVGSTSTHSSTDSCFTISLVHPSGAVTSSFPDDDRVLPNITSPKMWMVGGDKGTQTKLKQQLNELLHLGNNNSEHGNDNDTDETTVAFTMKRMVQALIRQYQQDDDNNNGKNDDDENNEMEEDLRPQSRRQHPVLEMVVLRPNGKVHRLTKSQANILVQSAMESLSSSSPSS
jgi:20S proteasome alpha/beta subunit